MKNRMVLLLPGILVIVLLTGGQGHADENGKIRLAKKFMELTDVPQMMGQVFKGTRDSEMKKLKGVSYSGKSPEKDEVLFKRVREYLDGKLTWSNFEEGYAKVYASFFTEEELKQLVDFYSSPLARKLTGGDRELKMKLLESTQMQMKDMAISIRKMENDFIAEQKKEKRHE